MWKRDQPGGIKKHVGWMLLALSLFISCSSGGSHLHSAEIKTPPIPAPNPTPPPVKTPPKGMVLVVGGTFKMGSNNYFDSTPIPNVTVRSFFLDQTEVTAEAYQACVAADKCSIPLMGAAGLYYNYDRDQRKVVAGRENHPINGVNFQQSKHYCEVQGKRLPTEVEWEYAARGSAESLYPWGNEHPRKKPVCWEEKTGTVGTCEVKQFETTLLGMNETQLKQHKLLGVYGLAGNVLEWVDTEYVAPLSITNKPCDSARSSRCVLRGGVFESGITINSAFRYPYPPSTAGSVIGFRCAKDE